MKTRLCLMFAGALFAAGCQTHPDDDREDGEEVDVALADVPASVLSAAKKAVPGIAFTGAEKETEDGVVVYSIEGEAEGKRYEVEVDAKGKILEVEEGDDDDDEHEDDED